MTNWKDGSNSLEPEKLIQILDDSKKMILYC